MVSPEGDDRHNSCNTGHLDHHKLDASMIKNTFEYDPSGLLGASLTIQMPDGEEPDVQIVVGAFPENFGAGYFNKRSLGRLIEILQDVHEAMQ